MQPPPPPPPPPTGGYPPQPPAQYGGGYAPQPYAAGANYAGFWIRVVAYIIDAILLGIVSGAIDVAFHANPSDPNSSGTGIAGLINFVIGIAYFVGLWSAWGATLGQRIFNLRVVDANTMQPITAGKAIIRYIGLVISFLVCFVGVIWVAFDPRKQGWADKMASTLVVHA
jgi:uncharacterized RDD family membrane protein YckC